MRTAAFPRIVDVNVDIPTHLIKYGAFTLYIVYTDVVGYPHEDPLKLPCRMLGTVLRTKISLSLFVTIPSIFLICCGYCFLVYVTGEIFTCFLQGDCKISVAIHKSSTFLSCTFQESDNIKCSYDRVLTRILVAEI
jgi:hypothetical protein